MKKGFTIVELLVTLVIIALIGGIGIIAYNSIFSSANDNYYKTVENSLLLAGNEFFEKNRDELPIKGYSVVSMDNLVNGNYIAPLKDTKGGTCEKGDVYITRNPNNNQYEYEVCLKCLDYESEGNFCRGNIPGSININAYLESSHERYNPLLSYKNVLVVKDNVIVELYLNDEKLSYYKIDKVTDQCAKDNDRKCIAKIENSGSYLVSAFDKDNNKIADDRVINFKIDKENPTFEIVNDKRYLISGNNSTRSVTIKLENVKDDVGVSKIEYCITKNTECTTYQILNNNNNIISETLESGGYQIKVKVTDLVGNEKEKTSDFDVSYNAKLKYLDGTIKNFEVVYNKKYGYLNPLPNVDANKLIKWVYENTENNVLNTTDVTKTSEHILEAKYSNTIEIPTSNYCNNEDGKDYVKYTGSNIKLTKQEPFGVTFYNNIGQNVGTYTIKAKLLDGYIWNDGTTTDKEFNCKIEEGIIFDAITGSCNSLTYNGNNQTLASGGTNVSYSNNIGKNATTYTVTITANNGHAFSDKTTTKTLNCTINKAASSISCKSPQNFTGSDIISYSSSNGCTPAANSSVKNAGTYTVGCTGDTNHNNSTCNFTVNKVDVNLSCTNPAYSGYNQNIATCSDGVLSNQVRKNLGSQTVTCTGDANHNTKTATCKVVLPPFCSKENQICSFSGTKGVCYGANNSYNCKLITNGTNCTNDVFGDAAPNVEKSCYTVGGTAVNSSWWYVPAGSGSLQTCIAGCSCMCDAKGNSNKCGGPPEGPLAAWACGDSAENNPGSPGTVEGGKCWCYGDKNKWDNFSW